MRNSRSWLAAGVVALAVLALLVPIHPGRAAEPTPRLDLPLDIQDPDDGQFDTDDPDQSEAAPPDADRQQGIGREDKGDRSGPEQSQSANPQDVGREGMGRPYAIEKRKADGDDLLGGEEAPVASDPAARAAVLNELYDRLRAAKDAKAAEPISEAIEHAWRMSGSDTIDLLMARVDSFVLSMDLDLALQVLDAVTELAPDDAEAWHQRGIVNFMKGDDQRALTDVRRSLDLDPKNYKAQKDLGMVLRGTGDKKGALAAYRKALELNPFFDQARPAEQELSREVEGQNI